MKRMWWIFFMMLCCCTTVPDGLDGIYSVEIGQDISGAMDIVDGDGTAVLTDGVTECEFQIQARSQVLDLHIGFDVDGSRDFTAHVSAGGGIIQGICSGGQAFSLDGEDFDAMRLF
jgi:hypothetical protein